MLEKWSNFRVKIDKQKIFFTLMLGDKYSVTLRLSWLVLKSDRPGRSSPTHLWTTGKYS